MYLLKTQKIVFKKKKNKRIDRKRQGRKIEIINKGSKCLGAKKGKVRKDTSEWTDLWSRRAIKG